MNMKRLSFILFLYLPVQMALAQTTGKVIEQLVVKSAILNKDVKYTIYLPADYEHSQRSYPIVYLLHGYTDDNTGWLQFGEVNRYADKAIADGNHPSDDHRDAQWRFELVYQFLRWQGEV